MSPFPVPRAVAAYNMVNPCAFRQGRSLCSLKREIQTVAHRANDGDEGQDRRFNVGALLGTLASALALAVLVLLGVLVWRERRATALARAADQLATIVRDGRYAERVHTGSV